MLKNKRKALIVFLVSVLFLLSSCNNLTLNDRKFRENNGGFSVHYLDVGQGDASFIFFPDGKTMLIDTGNGVENNNKYILDFLSNFSVNKIDYLVLTHPDADHVSGTAEIINKINVEKTYLPCVLEPANFFHFNKAVMALEDNNVSIVISAFGNFIKGEDYLVAFLTPYPIDFPSSSYDNLNKEFPNENEINDASPIIYIEYKGVRFLFTGDAGVSQENLLLNDEKVIISFFENFNVNINLTNIDFLKVAHHGSAYNTSERFLERINPKNAVISVGGLNSYNLPSTQLLQRLNQICPAHNLYRTDVDGTVSVKVSPDGTKLIETDLTIK